MKTIVYIISLGHSGSTLLDYLISQNKSLISLGEIYNLYCQKPNTEGTKNKCSCGETYNNCLVWSNNFVKVDYMSFYISVINKVEEIFPNALAIVDSSKKKCALEKLVALHNQEKINLKVIYLYKDVREFSASMKRHLTNDKKIYVPNSLRYFIWFKMWHKDNLKIYNFLKNLKIEFFQVSYKDLCQKTEDTLNKIFVFADLDIEKVFSKITNNIHIADGNRTKYKLSKKFQVSYDNKWEKDYICRILYFLHLRVISLNRKFQSYSLSVYKSNKCKAKDLTHL